MCMRKYVVQKQMLGSREQGWACWSGKEIVEMTSNEIKKAIKKGEEIFGLVIGESGELEVDRTGFFCVNVMEHRQVNNYKPMIDDENSMANVFYIIMGKNEAGLYEAVSSKFERASFTKEKVQLMLEMGVISAGAKLEDGEVVVPDLEKLVKKPEPEKVEPVAEKKPEPEKVEPVVEKQEEPEVEKPAAEAEQTVEKAEPIVAAAKQASKKNNQNKSAKAGKKAV